MSQYRFILRDYHAIQEADITIDGITVMSGINGCGKSTLSRWLYYIIKGSIGFEDNLLRTYIQKLNSLVSRMLFVCRDIEIFKRTNNRLGSSTQDKLYEIQEKLRHIDRYSQQQVELALGLFLQASSTITDALLRNLDENMPEVRKRRIMRYLDIDITDNNVQQSVDDFSTRMSRIGNKLTSSLYQDIELRSIQRFLETLDQQFNTKDDHPSYIQLEEDGVNLIDEHLSNLYNLRNAIYIDTPMSVTSDTSGNIFWNALREMIMEGEKENISTEVKKLLLRIKILLDGQVFLEKEDDPFNSPKLRYVSSDQQVNIKLNEVATGFKTFSYLQRLLENGYLNEETLLMIDEPEAHLHPQWIVEFARMLVLLNKTLGLKIILASHNPDMVSAIHDIAHKEGVLDNTNFYVAQPSDENRHQFVYKALGHEISEIFKSFNIAIDRIKQYGTADL